MPLASATADRVSDIFAVNVFGEVDPTGQSEPPGTARSPQRSYAG
jgi:hypothetical protein